MEAGRIMLLHAFILGIIFYIFMVYALGQSQIVAENRSILLASALLMYMIMFGHGLPTTINRQIF